jgi:hypothetical protein
VTTRRYNNSIGSDEGSIIATIMVIHIVANIAPAPSHPCPGIRIHAIPIVQPPGIGITALIIRSDDSVRAAGARKTRSVQM